MDREIVLSSYRVKSQGGNTPQDFTTKFDIPIMLDSNYQYTVGLNRIINMSFTWFNVNSSYKNQLIKYSSDNGSMFKEITFPAGVWNYTDFNTYIKDITIVKLSKMVLIIMSILSLLNSIIQHSGFRSH